MYGDVHTIVVENGSDSGVVEENARFIEAQSNVDHVLLDSNRGVWGGRNRAIELSKGEFLLELDDDAVFDNTDAIERAVAYMSAEREVGILAFQVINFHTRTITPQEYPFRDKNRDPEESGPCAWFIGAGHLIRRSVIDRIGLYREFHPWGSEELDLSLRAMDEGYCIHYFSGSRVLHKKSPNARVTHPLQFGRMALKNRVKVALLNLPWCSAVSYFLVRGTQLAIRYRDPRIPVCALVDLWKERDYIVKHRKRVQRRTLAKLGELEGPIYF